MKCSLFAALILCTTSAAATDSDSLTTVLRLNAAATIYQDECVNLRTYKPLSEDIQNFQMNLVDAMHGMDEETSTLTRVKLEVHTEIMRDLLRDEGRDRFCLAFERELSVK